MKRRSVLVSPLLWIGLHGPFTRGRHRRNHMDNPVARALALALMRQAKEYLTATKDLDAADQLQNAIDTLLTPRTPVAA